MAVPMQQRFAMELGHLVIRRLVPQEIGEGERVRLQPLAIAVVRQHVGQLVLEHRPATGLQHNHRRARLDVRLQFDQHVLEPALGHVEKAVVVQWPAAAHVLHRHDYVEAGVLQHLDGGFAGVDVVIIVERVGEEHDRRAGGMFRFVRQEPFLETLRRERRDKPRLLHSRDKF